MSIAADRRFLLRALQLAQQRRGFCAPNPAVGAVLVAGGTIIGEGTHFAPGHPHAEVIALSAQHAHSKNLTLYVTLEPCCHYGRTPPCTDLIIAQGITRVVFAACDPNPHVNGQGMQQLIASGIDCVHVPVTKINQFYSSYQHWHNTKTPAFTAKIALSLDGKYARPGGARTLLTGDKVAKFTHQCRKHSDAILTSANTVLHDNPYLNVRLSNETIAKPIIVLDSHLRLTLQENIFQGDAPVYLFHGPDAPAVKITRCQHAGIHCIAIPHTEVGLDLHMLTQHLGILGFHDVWIEAGGQLLSAFLHENLLHRLYVYVAPIWLGSNALPALHDKRLLQNQKVIKWHIFGRDAVCEFIF